MIMLGVSLRIASTLLYCFFEISSFVIKVIFLLVSTNGVFKPEVVVIVAQWQQPCALPDR